MTHTRTLGEVASVCIPQILQLLTWLVTAICNSSSIAGCFAYRKSFFVCETRPPPSTPREELTISPQRLVDVQLSRKSSYSYTCLYPWKGNILGYSLLMSLMRLVWKYMLLFYVITVIISSHHCLVIYKFFHIIDASKRAL